MSQTLTQADLIFPTASHSISSTLSSLKRSALSIHNRLSSITSDSIFVNTVSTAYDLPLVANERCGGWYIPPEKKTESCYFKSTDGHMNEWSFNLRRLNLQLLDVVGTNGGCVIVDSTRRGKSMPDALLKTIPIWCCVMNRAIFPDTGPHELHTPPQAVSASEHAQIEKRIDSFVTQFLEICAPNIPDLRQRIQKPLRPLWVIQSSSIPETPPSFPEFHPVVLCTASRRVHGNEGSEEGYIQGAADDQEAWSHGLTSKLFWSNKDKILNTNEDELPDLIASLITDDKGPDAAPILISPTTRLFVSSSQNVDISSFETIISCAPSPLTTTNPAYLNKNYLHLPCGTGKLGSRDLRTQLSRLPAFFTALPEDIGNILVCCPTGKDLSVGVALAILCSYTDENGGISNANSGRKIDKRFIKQRMTWIATTSPVLNPSRGTLQTVNAFLMPDPYSTSRVAEEGYDVVTSRLALVDENGVPISIDESVPAAVQTIDLPLSVFNRLQTKSTPWTFTRTLISRLPTHPSGTVTGTATLTPYSPSSRIDSDTTFLYAEEGEFVTTTGLHLTTRRKYIYQVEVDDKTGSGSISVLFHEAEKNDGLGGLFVEMGDLTTCEDGVLVARNREQHLCGEDLYTASWRFGTGMYAIEREIREGKGEAWWEVCYDVVGPQKDYVSKTMYTMS
ncbi:hypothetical protein K504DRAFT_421695 [Pleomassaria siparia CBS 279.74]|uniref:Initiator tRNA phosphoribosyl transferase n=1 Tax=Pleomassaria siparia CBS 279.74 TaxID=1314801 RepID=A0A6G1KQQ6_9PLEO|nr:hypothetical protein K504DRAFT_421695 [Pleomassaria siparia CBS 279.74]